MFAPIQEVFEQRFYEQVNVQCFVSFNSLGLPLDVACFKRSYYLTKKWNKLRDYYLSLKFIRIPIVNIPKYLQFFCMTLSPKSQSLITISLHVCYQYINVVKASFCLRAKSSIMAQELWHLKFNQHNCYSICVTLRGKS